MALTKKVFEKRGEIHLAFILSARLCIAMQNLSIGVNVVSPPDEQFLLLSYIFLLFTFVGGGALDAPQRPPCLKGAVTAGDWGIYPSTAYAVPLPLGEGGFYAYNNFTNYEAIICKRGRFILTVSFFWFL